MSVRPLIGGLVWSIQKVEGALTTNSARKTEIWEWGLEASTGNGKDIQSVTSDGVWVKGTSPSHRR